MICQRFSPETMPEIKIHCRIFVPITDREYWENAKKYNLEDIEKKNREYDGRERKMLTASLYREFTVNGNRTNYQDIYFARREKLVLKTVLTCFYNDDRYLEDITDLLWMILEESSWTLPAHNAADKSSDSMPNTEKRFIDLFLAETACTLAFVYQTIGEKLDMVSKVFRERIAKRLTDDIIDNFLSSDHYWWMIVKDGKIGNWTPWICSNVLAVSLIMENDAEKLRRLVYKLAKIVDLYIDRYPEDGACDEGANYWPQSGFAMMECLWLLCMASDGAIDFWAEEKVRNTLGFLSKEHTGENSFVNFADCPLKIPTFYGSLYKMAKIIQDEKTVAFAKMLSETLGIPSEAYTKVFRLSDFLTYRGEMEKIKCEPFVPVQDCYFESTEVLLSRTDGGLLFAAKGGSNNELHNHNDVGNFIVYKNGTRFLVDAGMAEYTRESFSEKRYTIWANRSLFHNVPYIGGKEQNNDATYKTENVQYTKTEHAVRFSMDLRNMYENREDINTWERCFVFNKKAEEICVCERFDLKEEMPISLRFLTPQKVSFSVNSVILSSPTGETLCMEFEGADFAFSVESVMADDRQTAESWPEGLSVFTVQTKGKKGTIEYRIK